MADRANGLHVDLRQAAPIPLDCAFACAPGELLALVGPSGSGKSTVLRCIAGLARPAAGTVRCAGEPWLDATRCLPPQRRRVGMVFQNYSLLPHLDAAGNVAVALGSLPPGQRRARAAEWLARVRLDGLEGRRPAELSGGQQQRVALARALARTEGADDGVLLLDEPFSAVDQVTRARLQEELARLRRELAAPIVLVTHDLDEARRLADRLVLLHRGAVLQSGSPEDILGRPATPAVARLVGLSNLFAGQVAAGGSGLELAWAGRRLAVADFRGFAAGDRVSWVIPPDGILLHRPDRPTPGDAENPVAGTVLDSIRLGSFTQLVLAVPGEDQPLAFPVSTRAAERNRIVPGRAASVTLLAARIHLMADQLAS